jgi:hypothetical protein
MTGEAPSATSRFYSNGRNSYSSLVPCVRRTSKISTFELRSRIAFWLDSLEQRKHLKRIERSNSKMQLTRYSSIKYSKDCKKINDGSGALWETVNRDAERDDTTGRTPRSGRVGSKYHHENRGEYFEKKVWGFLLLRCLIRPSLRHEKHISTFELRSRIAFWLDSLEQRKRLERIERSNSKMQLTKYSSIKCSKDSKKIDDRSGALWETVNRDAERDDATGRTPRSGWVGSKYRHKKRGEYFEKRCEAFCFYDAL